MDRFEHNYEENFDAIEQSLLKEKREKYYEFFSASLSLIVVILFWLSFIFSVYNALSAFGTNDESAFSNGLSLILEVALGIIIPIAAYKLYRGSKNKNVVEINSGFDWIIMYLKIIKVILIIASIIFAGIALLSVFIAPQIIIALMIVAGIVALAFYIITIFKEFFINLKTAFNSEKRYIPSAQKIKTYLIVILVLTIIFGLLFMMLLQNIESFLPDGFEDQFEDLQASLDAVRITWYISLAIGVFIQAFFVYYVHVFDQTFEPFNVYFLKKVEAYEKQQLENESSTTI